jgi:hypothetical protein
MITYIGSEVGLGFMLKDMPEGQYDKSQPSSPPNVEHAKRRCMHASGYKFTMDLHQHDNADVEPPFGNATEPHDPHGVIMASLHQTSQTNGTLVIMCTGCEFEGSVRNLNSSNVTRICVYA